MVLNPLSLSRYLGQGAGIPSLLDLDTCSRRDEVLGLVCTVLVLEAAGTFPNLARPTSGHFSRACCLTDPLESFPLQGYCHIEISNTGRSWAEDSETYPGSRRRSQCPATTYHRVEVWPGKGRVFTHPSIPAADVGGAGPHCRSVFYLTGPFVSLFANNLSGGVD